MENLSLESLINLSGLEDPQSFSQVGIFDLVGKPLTAFVRSLCHRVGCEDEPVVAGDVHPTAVLEGQVFVAEGARVGPHAFIQGPTFIAAGAEVRHAAYIRGSVYVGYRAVVGHTTEVKGSVFFDEAKAGHFSYVGDSILGCDVNLGAGTKLANLKLKGDEVKFKHPESGDIVGSGLRKFGAVLGDRAQTGCNAVLSPGTILRPGSLVMPCSHFHGTK